MKRVSLFILAATVLAAVSNSCAGLSAPAEHGIPVYEKNEALGITAVPDSMDADYIVAFDRYTCVTAPGGGRIHIVAQNRITNEQMLRARGILEHYLSDKNGVLFGGTKAAVADRMAENGAILTLLNYRDDGSNKTNLAGQSLFEEELPVDGSSWYTENRYEEHRDAAFEEILHLVHDYGIGVDGPGGLRGAMLEAQKRIRAAQEYALKNGIWAIGMNPCSGWLLELRLENSLTQEYLASVIDSWYGLWGAWKEDRGMWGFYIAKTRDDVRIEDSQGAAIAGELFAPFISYDSRIDAAFNGTFCMAFDSTIPYTHKSQYLKNITLTGSAETAVRVNSYDNRITGNSGKNTVVFSGPEAEYRVVRDGNWTVVTDSINGRDGTNRLRSVEKLRFSDREIPVE